MALEKITSAQMDAAGVIAAPDVLSGSAVENKKIFDRMVRELVAPAYNACVDAVNELMDTEEGIKKEEALREAAETERTEAETTRKAAEQKRETAEQARTKAEDVRNTSEEIRSTAEENRKAAETDRENAETERKTQEQNRKTAEEARAAAETEREQTFYVMKNRIEQMDVEAETLQAGAAATADVEVDPATGGYKITLGIPKGRDGDGGGSGDMLQATYDPQGKEQDIFEYAENKAEEAVEMHNESEEAHQDIRQLIANKKGAQVYTATIGTSWTENEDTGVKYQTVSISGVTAGHTAKVDHSSASIDGTSDGYAVFVEEENQYLTYVTNGFAETVDGGIQFTIFGDAPTVNIPIVVEVV